MAKLCSKLIALLIIISSLFCCACNNNIGGISINTTDTVVGGTVFDTKNLKLAKADIRGDIDYAIKVLGSTVPLNDATWNKWFKDEKHDIEGKIAVCLKLEYDDKIANDTNATITLPLSVSSEETKTIKINEITDGTVDKNYIYIILNPRHDVVNVTINYLDGDINKEIKYEIDLMNVNADTSRLQ